MEKNAAAGSASPLIQSFEGVVRAMGKMVEQRDPYTAGHAEGVSRLAVAIGRQLGMDAERIEGLRIAGLLHDIGKVSVPAEILTKPSTLSPLEYEVVKLHAAAGYEILKSIPFPWPVAQATLQHHERQDGSGYPAGLGADKIILEARILAVADVVDAMTTHRPYRPAIGIGGALEELKKGSGTLYDPQAAAACVEVVTKQDKRIMVVDDENPILDLVEEYLTMMGYEVRTFDSPLRALEFFSRQPFPLVLTDLDMPQMHGLELVKRLREVRPDTQFMILTGHGRKEDAVLALRLGVSDFLDKPIQLSILKDMVENAFQRSQKQRISHLQSEAEGK